MDGRRKLSRNCLPRQPARPQSHEGTWVRESQPAERGRMVRRRRDCCFSAALARTNTGRTAKVGWFNTFELERRARGELERGRERTQGQRPPGHPFQELWHSTVSWTLVLKCSVSGDELRQTRLSSWNKGRTFRHPHIFRARKKNSTSMARSIIHYPSLTLR